MRSKHFLGLVLAGCAMAAVAAGCGGGDDTSTTSTTSGTGGSATTSTSNTGTGGSGTTTTTTTGVGSTGSGGAKGDGNDTPETATEVAYGEQQQGMALDPTGDVDYYKFSGKKGDAIAVIISAQSTDQAPFDPSYIDTVVTLFDANKNQLAENDDPEPRSSNDSQLYTILPADGDYYVRVEECWTWADGQQGVACADPKDKDNNAYDFIVGALDPATDGIVMDAEAGNDETNPTPLEYATDGNGSYYITQAYGTFTDDKDVDVYSFNMPDPGGTTGEPVGYFTFLKDGTEGDGSTTPVGDVYVADKLSPTVKIAEIDGTLTTDLSPPLQFGHDYLLFVQHPAGAAGTNDFYFFNHNAGGSNPLETEAAVGQNDTWAVAETLDAQQVSDPSVLGAWFVEGKILPAPADTDFFKFDMPANLDPGAKVSIACGAQRSGSGLRGLTFALTDGAGKSLAMATETGDADAFLQDQDIPAGSTTLGVKLTATSQDASVTSSFYRCGIYVAVPQ